MLEQGKNERGVIEMVDMESLAPAEHLLWKVDAAVGKPGEQIHKAVFTPADKMNYHIMSVAIALTVSNRDNVQKGMDQIGALPNEVTTKDDVDKVMAAQAACRTLSDEEKRIVSGDVLEALENAVKQAEALYDPSSRPDKSASAGSNPI